MAKYGFGKSGNAKLRERWLKKQKIKIPTMEEIQEHYKQMGAKTVSVGAPKVVKLEDWSKHED